MKKIKLLVFMFLFSAGLTTLFPCDISFETAKIVENGKNKINIKILVDIVHRNCPVDIEKTRLVFDGIQIEKKSPWIKIDACTWEMELTGTLPGNKTGEIHVVRECSKRGLHQESLKIEAQ
ncbi:hypothetical protein EH223_09180 [candidate division KSB1 bacterium]|nr:hypothetical protein [Candidatus Aminicenantes bacterium]RQW03554.1 MAG: hypothetical protein EH223_09180 [candidate division KSB1 bacterium]